MLDNPSVSILASQLRGYIEDIAINLYGEPTSVSGNDLRFGKNGALSVNVKKQVFKDFESDEGGGPFQLILRFHGGDVDFATAWA